MVFSLGVDIGTTYTAAALWRNQTVNTAPLSVPSSAPLGNHSNAVPSVLFLRDDGTLLVGDAATRRAIAEPGRAAREFKRRMGDDVPIRLDGQSVHGSFHAHELTGHLLRWVVDTVSEREGERPGHVVLTHPAEWGEYRRGLLTAAAGTAGLDDVGLLPEPIAAATWYAAQERVEPDSLIGIYDLGGGTFDASVVRKTGTGFEVYGEPGGDDSIGGIDFDHVLLRHVASAVGVDLAGLADTDDPATASALAALLTAVVDAKEALSADVEAVVPVLLPGLTRQVTVRRGEFEALVRPRLLATVQLFAQIVARAGADPATLRAVLLVGGSSRIPLVSRLLRAELGIAVAVDAHPKYAVSLGAAIAAAPRVEPAVAPTSTAGPAVAPPVIGRAAVPAVPAVPAGSPFDVGRSSPIQPGQKGLDRPTSNGGGDGVATTVDVQTEPAVAAAVDLAGTGLTAPTDVPVSPPQPVGEQPVVTDRDEPVRIRTRDGDSTGSGRRIAVLAFVVLVVAAVAVAAVAARGRRGNPPGPHGTAPPAAAPTTAIPSTGTARLTGQLIADPPGPDTMRGVAPRPGGGLVAVGLSVDLHPRAWVRPAGQPWRSVPLPSPGTGVMSDVAAGVAAGRGGQLVAVGWTRDTGAVQHPAVWVSANGDSWRQATPAGDSAGDLAADGLTELTAIVPVASGGYLAIGVDRKADSVDGDGAVFRSDNGQDWHRVAATGMDGSGPQEVHRVAQAGDGRFVAVGSALTGARRGPAVWTSSDGTQWQLTGSSPPGSPTLWAVHLQPDGSLVACGSSGTVDEPAAGCWLKRGDGDWQPYQVAADPGSAAPLYVYALAATPDGLVAVGLGRDAAGADATAWTVQLP
jgi:molecular chaperone DnaK